MEDFRPFALSIDHNEKEHFLMGPHSQCVLDTNEFQTSPMGVPVQQYVDSV
jgi:hypothetical protein